MTEPIRLTFQVACSPQRAFQIWTERIGTWWPIDHTVTAQPALAVILEGTPGGRIYERTAAGVEHNWGQVTLWEPPQRLGYLWHLRRDRADATEVEIRFVEADGGRTDVHIEHRGWERLGAEADSWRDRNYHGWSTLLPHYVASVDAFLAEEGE